MARKKKTIITENITPESAGEYMSLYAKAVAEEKKIEADIELKIHKLRDQYKDRLVELKADKDYAFERLEHFAESNPELFTKKKSADFPHGTVGFRTGTPKLGLIKGFTWASVLLLVKDKLPSFVRTKEEVDKESLLAQRNDEGMEQYMAKCGMEVIQDETFYVESREEVLAA